MKYKTAQLKQGIKAEAEHASTIRFIKNYHKTYKKFPTNDMIYTKIAQNHLAESPRYYSMLKKVEAQTRKRRSKR